MYSIMREREPWGKCIGDFLQSALVGKFQRAIMSMKRAHACHGVDAETHRLDPGVCLGPERRFIAIHLVEELARVVASKLLLDVTCDTPRIIEAPLWKESCVDHPEGGVFVEHGLMAQPVAELAGIGRIEHIVEGVFLARFGSARHYSEHVQVVVARGDDGALLHGKTQDADRVRAVVHEISHEVERITRPVIGDLVHQVHQSLIGAMHIADNVSGHL